MSVLNLRLILATIAFAGAVAGLLIPLGPARSSSWATILATIFAVFAVALAAIIRSGRSENAGDFVARMSLFGLALLPHIGAFALIGMLTDHAGMVGAGYWALVVSAWALAWLLVDMLSGLKSNRHHQQIVLSIIIPALFGIWLLILWEIIVRGLGVPTVLLPPPSMIGARFAASLPLAPSPLRRGGLPTR